MNQQMYSKYHYSIQFVLWPHINKRSYYAIQFNTEHVQVLYKTFIPMQCGTWTLISINVLVKTICLMNNAIQKQFCRNKSRRINWNIYIYILAYFQQCSKWWKKIMIGYIPWCSGYFIKPPSSPWIWWRLYYSLWEVKTISECGTMNLCEN